MEIVNVVPNHHHGGCMRYFIGHKGEHIKNQSVLKQLEKEESLGLHNKEIFDEFQIACESSRKILLELLDKLKMRGKRIVGYGATAKSATLINYCGISKDHIDFICDTTLAKQGKFSPGAHIPVVSHEEFCNKYPDYTI